MKDKVDRASSKFIHDPMPLCPVSACEITIPAAPVTFNVLIPGDVDPRDKKLAGSNLSATYGSAESMGTTAAEPQAVPEKKMRRADGVFLVEDEAGPANVTAATSRPSNWDTFSPSRKAHFRRQTRRRNK